MQKTKMQRLILIAFFTALTAIGSYLRFAVPFSPVPVTMQTFFVLLSGFLLGKREGAFSQLLFLTLGLCGLPVFAGGGGLQYILMPSFGYLIGFVFCAFFVGLLGERFLTFESGLGPYLLIATIGFFIYSLFGIGYLYGIIRFYQGNAVAIQSILWSGFLVFLPGDLLKIVGASLAAKRLYKIFY
jgi:biotin transport system substrate-specific component